MRKNNAFALETSGPFLSLAFLREGKILPGLHDPVRFQHENIFWKEFPRRLHRARLSLKDLSYAAVTRGPGRFTGIRLSLGIAITWSQILRIPIFAPRTTELLEWQAEEVGSQESGVKEGHLLIPNAESLLRFSLKESKKHWYTPKRPPRALYMKESWK